MGNNSKSMFIKLNNISNIKEFTTMASTVSDDVEVRRGRWCIDAKSLMGMFSIDVSDGFTVVYPADAVDFEKFIKQFEA